MNNTPDAETLQKVMAELEKNPITHPAIALVLASSLEQQLRTLLEIHMPGLSRDSSDKIFKGYGPLASFSAKIDVTRALGLISAPERTTLHFIRDVRNAFAHTINLTINFEHETLKKNFDKNPNPPSKIYSNFRAFNDSCAECMDSLRLKIEAATLSESIKKAARAKPSSTDRDS